MVCTLAILSGCEQSPPPATEISSEDQLHAMKVALIKQDWPTAMRLADSVLDDPANAQDPQLLFKISRAAHAVGDRERSAELLRKANRAEGFHSEMHVRQAVVAMVEIGQLEEAFAWLEKVLEQQPNQYSTRRWLFDLYRSVDRVVDAREHGKFLIRNRQFDVKLLQSMIRRKPPVKDLTAINAMVDRNPDDKRPLLRVAEISFWDEDYSESIKVCDQILALHEDYAPAQVLKALCLAKTMRLGQAKEFLGQLSIEEVQQYPRYWLATAIVASGDGESMDAFESYRRAAAVDVNFVPAWEGLVAVVRQSGEGEFGAGMTVLEQMQRRIEQLTSLLNHEDLFNRTGRISREVAIEIAEDLSGLGRLWEAEAWASLALTLPPDDSVDVDSVRQRMVRGLAEGTPFQVIQGHPELEFVRSLVGGRVIGAIVNGKQESPA